MGGVPDHWLKKRTQFILTHCPEMSYDDTVPWDQRRVSRVWHSRAHWEYDSSPALGAAVFPYGFG